MTEFINVGANDGAGNRFKTKAELKRTVASAQDHDDLESVFFDQTSMSHSGRIPGTCSIQDLMNAPAGTQLQVVGPDPYTKRNWYATVKIGRGGRVQVS